MEKPEYAPNFMGEMMKNCWLKKPKERPTFSQMADVISKQIEFVVGIDYLNLNGGENENGLTREIDDPTQNESFVNCENVKQRNDYNRRR